MKNSSTAECHLINVKPQRRAKHRRWGRHRPRSGVCRRWWRGGGLGGLNGLVSVGGMTAIPPKEAVPAWEALNNAIHHSNTIAQTPPSRGAIITSTSAF